MQIKRQALRWKDRIKIEIQIFDEKIERQILRKKEGYLDRKIGIEMERYLDEKIDIKTERKKYRLKDKY